MAARRKPSLSDRFLRKVLWPVARKPDRAQGPRRSFGFGAARSGTLTQKCHGFRQGWPDPHSLSGAILVSTLSRLIVVILSIVVERLCL